MRDRRRRLATIHAAKRSLGLDDDAYRSLLAGAAGVESAAELKTDRQFAQVMQGFRAAGWRGSGRLSGQWKAAYAWWSRLCADGEVRDGSYEAMMAWVRGRYGDQDIYRTDQVRSVVESLKRWHGRLRDNEECGRSTTANSAS